MVAKILPEKVFVKMDFFFVPLYGLPLLGHISHFYRPQKGIVTMINKKRSKFLGHITQFLPQKVPLLGYITFSKLRVNLFLGYTIHDLKIWGFFRGIFTLFRIKLNKI